MSADPNLEFEYSGVENLEAMKHARNYNRFLIRLVQRQIRGKRVLDFGAGAGTFAQPLRDAGYAVECVEPDPELRKTLTATGLTSYPDISVVPAGQLDSIYSLNVLEHVQDDAGALRALYACLREGGRAIIYVPAFAVLFSAMDERVGHHRRYRRKELVSKMRAAGFTIDAARYIDSLGFFSALVYRWIGNDSGVISPGSVKIYDRFIFPLSALLDRLLLGSFGKNLLVVGTR